MITAIVTHYNRSQLLVDRAIDSVDAQTLSPAKILVTDNPDTPPRVPAGWRLMWTRRPDAPYLSWYDAIHRAGTEYVAILHDDDWWEPTFLERLLGMLVTDPACGFAFCQATVHLASGDAANLSGAPPGSHRLATRPLADMMAHRNSIISPSCCVHRRADLLRNLLPGGIPMTIYHGDTLCGPDALLTMIPMMEYGAAAWVGEPLCHMDGTQGSLTVEKAGAKMQANYRAAWMLTSMLAAQATPVKP